MTEGLAARIRTCAALVGSGDELARLTAIPRRTLEYYLTGDSEPKLARCVDIAKAAGVDIGWLGCRGGGNAQRCPG
ncbi:helix-turn-helix domain-containing protein [Pseudomonas aeruginosa]|uniref:helix-turn-helix domain-containing protein n=1 Tax=Pseudomonas aeruginosa TaxID=287 RepID=UPI003CC90ECA